MKPFLPLAILALALAALVAAALVDAPRFGLRGAGPGVNGSGVNGPLRTRSAPPGQAPPDALRALGEPSLIAGGTEGGDAEGARLPVSADLVRVRVTASGGSRSDLPVHVFAAGGAPFGGGASTDQARRHAGNGKRTIADAEGLALVRRPSERFTVFADTGLARAWSVVGADEREIALELAPWPGLSVRVVDFQGDPAGGVATVLQEEKLQRGTTDVYGVARFHRRGIGSVEPGRAGAIRIEAALREPLVVPFAREPSDAQRIDVALPPCGALDVRYLAAGGAPFPLPRCELRIAVVVAGVPQPRATVRFEGDACVVPHVELGQRLALTLALDGGDVPLGTVSGPARAGDVVTLPFVLDPAVRFLRGRAVDASGRPVSAALRATFVSDFERSPARDVGGLGAAQDGVFHLRVLDADLEHAPTSVELLAWSDAMPRGRAPLSSPLPPGLTDLGDVVLGPAPLLAAGVVRDAAGTPVAHARVGAGEVPDDWVLSPFERSTRLGQADALGAFAIRGWSSDAAPLALFAAYDGFAQLAPVSVTPGATDAVLVLHARGALRARVLIPDGMRQTDLLVRVRSRVTGALAHARIGKVPRPGELAYRVDAIDPGPALVELLYARTGERLAAVDDVLVASGGETLDARLDPLDLRGLLALHRLSFRDAGGRPLVPDVVRWRASGASAWTDHGRVGADRAVVTTRSGEIDVDIAADGYRSAHARGVAGEHVIELARGVPVRFTVPRPSDSTADVALFLAGTATTWMPRRRIALDAEGSAALALGPGRYALWSAGELGQRCVEEVLVHDVADEQHFVLLKLAGALRAASSGW